MTNIKYGSPTIHNEGNIKFNKFELKTNENVSVMYILLLRN